MTTLKFKSEQNRKTWLVWGYLRNIKALYKDLNIPIEINDIIYLFHHFYDSWSPKYKSEYTTIDTDKSMVTISANDGVAVYGKEVIKEGIYQWRVKIISFKYKNGDSYPHIGIIENDEKVLKNLKRVNFFYGYFLCAGFGKVYSRLKKADESSSNRRLLWTQNGDILNIKLDLNGDKLYFKMNDLDINEWCRHQKDTDLL